MLFGSKDSPTPAAPLVEGAMKLRGVLVMNKAGGFEAELTGELHAAATLQILPGAEVEGKVTSGDEIVLHTGSRVIGPVHARALDLQDGAVFSGILRVGPESPGGTS